MRYGIEFETGNMAKTPIAIKLNAGLVFSWTRYIGVALLTVSPPAIFDPMSNRSENPGSCRRKPDTEFKAELQGMLPHPYITPQGLSAESEAGKSGAKNEAECSNDPASSFE